MPLTRRVKSSSAVLAQEKGSKQLDKFGVQAVKPEDVILDYELPHHGEASSDRCGQEGVRAHFAKDGAHWQRYRHDCRQFDCGVCKSERNKDGTWDLKGWEAREAFAIRDRLDVFADLKPLSDYPTHRMSGTKVKRFRQKKKPAVFHVVISPPQAWAKAKMWSRQGYKAMWGQLYRVAASRGIIGGVALFHPARIPSKWNFRTCMASGPHWHVLGFMRWGDAYDAHVCSALSTGRALQDHSRLKSTLMALGMAKKETKAVAGDGWIVKVLPKRKDVASTAAYVLSHAGRPHVPDMDADPQKAARRAAYPASPRGTSGEYLRQSTKVLGVVPHWFGACSYNKLKVPESADGGILCHVCGICVPLDDWHKVEWFDPGGLAAPVGRFGKSSAQPWLLPGEVSEAQFSATWEEERAANARGRFEEARRLAE